MGLVPRLAARDRVLSVDLRGHGQSEQGGRDFTRGHLLYSQPEDPGYLMAQQSFASDHPWFQVVKLDARSHFPTLEVPEEVVAHIERFVSGVAVHRPEAPASSSPSR